MIRLVGSTKRSFIFPAGIEAALAYFSDLDRLFTFLPLIQLVKTYAPNQFRVVYSSLELNVYRVKLYSDLSLTIQYNPPLIEIQPLQRQSKIKSRATLHSLTAGAAYSSRSSFYPHGECTRIDYEIRLDGSLPKPLAMSLVPDTAISRIADSIARKRIHEIADGFIQQSLRAFEAECNCPPM